MRSTLACWTARLPRLRKRSKTSFGADTLNLTRGRGGEAYSLQWRAQMSRGVHLARDHTEADRRHWRCWGSRGEEEEEEEEEKTRMQMSRTFSRGPCYGGQLQCSWRRTRPHPQRIAAKTKQQHSRASVACQTRFGPHMSRISLLIILGIISLVLQLAEWKLPQNA
ncbi:unnamed protein product [Prorocentrum cordatum]|uniref:Uncharacterized protein n=1 Tax=Prorocentrum cordatum TaxID=2364126 RepID=A0ABN9TIG7_9DINO|nr:unnamed protein product [Polarella glacialis]